MHGSGTPVQISAPALLWLEFLTMVWIELAVIAQNFTRIRVLP